MSTRSITHVHQMESLDGDTIVCSFYRHSDGYPEGHGDDIAKWLAGKNLTNGIGSNFTKGRDFNRAGSMAIQLMAHIQESTSCEVIPTGSDGYDEEYEYHIRFGNKFYIECIDLYSGRAISTLASEFSGSAISAEWQEID